jgi:hypothetical protein
MYNTIRANTNDVVALGHVLGELLVGQYKDEEELNTVSHIHATDNSRF